MSDTNEQIIIPRASSGNMTTSNQYIVYWIECIQNSQNIANNTSNVTVKVHIKRTNTGYTTYGSGTVYCKINGTTYSASITSSQKITSSTITLFTKTMDIAHASDGSKTLAMSAWISHSQFSSSAQSYSQTLTTIPRTSSISVTSSVVAGNAVSVTINRASSSFTHKVYYTFGSYSATISTSATTSASYTIPIAHCNAIPNSTSGTATIRCETYSGTTKIGQVSKTFTVTVPSSVVPSFTSITCSPSGTDSSLGYVQGKTKLALAINGATGSYGSTIKSYKITGAGGTWNSQSVTTGVVGSTGSVTLTGTVTDSRGRTSPSKTVTITVNAYSNPKINSFSVYRCDSSGVAQADGTYVKCTYNASISSLGSQNAKSYTIRTYNGSTQTSVVSLDATNYSISGSAIYSGYATDKSYTVQLEVKDSFATTVQKVDIGTAYMTMDFKKGGKGVAFGKVAENDNMLDVNMKIRSFELNEHKMGHYCWKASNGGGTVGYLKIATLTVKSTYANQPIEFTLSQRGRHTMSKVIVHYTNTNNTDPELANFQHEGHMLTYIHKSASGIWDLYVLKSEGYDEVCVHDVNLPVYMAGKVVITWTDSLVTSLPSGSILASDMHRFSNLVLNNTSHNAERRIMASGTNVGFYWNTDGRLGAYDWKNSRGIWQYTITNPKFLVQTSLYTYHTYPNSTNTYDLGGTTLRWRTVYAVNALNTSDESYKENITYLGKSKSSDTISHEDLHEFYRSRYKIASYNYKEQEHTEYGFITQDMYDDKVGETLIVKDEENGDMYSTGSYISSVAGALQYEINLRDNQIKQLEDRLNKLEKILESFVVTLEEK